MTATHWHKQTIEKPLFPELLWSRPENKRQAGKLLIIGGNLHGFSAPAEAYQVATQAGAGTVKVLLPSVLQKVVGPMIENGEYAPSTPSGSFAQSSLAEFIDLAAWADAVLLAGDFGRNSETAIVIEKFLDKSQAQVTLTKDSVDYFSHLAVKLFKRPKTTLVITMAQLQRLIKDMAMTKSVSFGMDLLALVDLLHEITLQYPIQLIVKQNTQLIVAANGLVSTTAVQEMPIWRVKTAAMASVWWLQNPSKPFEALTTAIIPQ